MTPQELATLQREFLIRTEKQSAVLLDAEMEKINREISAFLAQNVERVPTVKNTTARNFLERILQLVENQVDTKSITFSKIVSRAQRNVVNFASNSLKKFLPEIEYSFFSPDTEAIEKLIGRTQTGTSLVKFFQRMKPIVATRAKRTLIEAFASGESNQEITRRLHAVTGAERFRVLTIARTETNEAYRAASREFYQAADIKQYVWLSVLDPRTCLICWSLHGRKFSSSGKIFSHPNCRCVLVPLVKNQTPISTGAAAFLKLETGVQRQILGAKRFEMFGAGKSFDEFVASRRDIEYGERFFVKNLSDLF